MEHECRGFVARIVGAVTVVQPRVREAQPRPGRAIAPTSGGRRGAGSGLLPHRRQFNRRARRARGRGIIRGHEPRATSRSSCSRASLAGVGAAYLVTRTGRHRSAARAGNAVRTNRGRCPRSSSSTRRAVRSARSGCAGTGLSLLRIRELPGHLSDDARDARGRAREALADLPAGDGPQVALVSVDPGRDTPPVLAQYVAHFDPSFTGVTGDRRRRSTR